MGDFKLSAKVMFYVFVGIAFYLIYWQKASAHQGILEDEDTGGFDSAIELVKPTVSCAVYASLDRSGDVDFIKFTLDSARCGT